MKTLILMRHAKSSWKDPKLEDHERPLNKRGKKDAPLMGKVIHEMELVPQLILSSTALRARQTTEAVIEQCKCDSKVEYLDTFYMGEPSAYIERLRMLPDDIERVMIVGHNPALETLLQILSRQIESLPTAVVAHIVLPIDHWSELNDESYGDLIGLWRPKELK
jgi:phosphohistidine phosphatase